MLLKVGQICDMLVSSHSKEESDTGTAQQHSKPYTAGC